MILSTAIFFIAFHRWIILQILQTAKTMKFISHEKEFLTYSIWDFLYIAQ